MIELKDEKINELNKKVQKMEKYQQYCENEYVKNMETMKMHLYTYKQAQLKLIKDYQQTTKLYQELKTKLHEYGIYFDNSKFKYYNNNLSRSSLQRRYILFKNYMDSILGENINAKKKIIIKYINECFPDIKEDFFIIGKQQSLLDLNVQLVDERKDIVHLKNLAYIFGKRLGLINASEYSKILTTNENIYIINEDGIFILLLLFFL